MPLVTVITPYRNAHRHAESFAHMILRQRYTKFFCYLIDDHSEDDSTQILKYHLRSDPRFIFFSLNQPKISNGPAEARNLGISHVTTPLIAFCDIDDLWHPSKLDAHIAFHLSNNLDLSVTSYFRFNLSSGRITSSEISPPPHLSYLKVLGNNPLPMLTVLVRSSLIRSGFPLCRHEDHALWISLFQCYPKIRYASLSSPLSYYAQHDANITRSNLKMLIWAFSLRYHLRLSPLIYTYSIILFLSQHLFSYFLHLAQPQPGHYTVQSLLNSNP